MISVVTVIRRDTDGAKGEVFQCYLCEGWFHAHAVCEHISSKHYKSFSSLAKSHSECCNYSRWHSQIKCIIAEFVKSSVTKSVKLSNVFEDTIQCVDQSLPDLTV